MGCTLYSDNNHWHFFIVFGFILLSLLVLMNMVSAGSTMSIETVEESLKEGDQSNISVMLTPETTVKSFEFGIRFNSSLIMVSNVMIGSFFDGYNTFSSNGTIDNVNGMISHVYELIIVYGMVYE